MPNLRAQIVGPLDSLGGAFVGKKGLYLQASDGRSVTITAAQVLAQFQAATGTAAQKKAAVLAWLKGTIVAALGAEQIDPAAISHDFDAATGAPTDLTVTG